MDENRTPNPEQQPNQPQGQPQNQAPQQPYQPQYQSYQQPQYQGYTQYYAPQKPANRGKGGGWIGFLRVMAWVLFALIEISVIVAGFMMIANSFNGYWGFSWALFGSGLGILAGGTLIAFIMVASINVTLDMAMNTARTATNTAKIAEKIEEIEKKLK